MITFDFKPKLLDVPDYSGLSQEPQFADVVDLKQKFS
jgi:hypothetical protein